jgi:catechol 2,3-dioxygenase-like lactoylglutathione lyase family enzyme
MDVGISEHTPGVSMPAFNKLTPNLLVSSVERSVAYYVDVLGFSRAMTVPEQSPFVFASVVRDGVEIFFNDVAAALKEYPAFAGKPLGATGTMFIEVSGIDDLHALLKDRATIVMPIVTQWYGMREFAISDPDGYLITFAERVG